MFRNLVVLPSMVVTLSSPSNLRRRLADGFFALFVSIKRKTDSRITAWFILPSRSSWISESVIPLVMTSLSWFQIHNWDRSWGICRLHIDQERYQGTDAFLCFYLESDFIGSLPYGSWFSRTENLGSLLDLS